MEQEGPGTRDRAVLVVNAEVEGRPGHSVLVRRGVVADVGPALSPAPGCVVLDAHGGAVIPGLHDHHVHLRSVVAAGRSVALDPVSVAAAGGFTAALLDGAARLGPGEWLRGVGARGLEAESLDRWALDAIIADRPVRLQHRGGALWLLNSAAIRALGVDGWDDDGVERSGRVPTGRLWYLDRRVRDALAGAVPDQTADLAALSEEALALGITGFTDATPDRSQADFDDLDAHVLGGRIHQRLTLMGGPWLRPGRRARVGPRKLVLDDHAMPSEGALVGLVVSTHSQESPVAIHCVTAEQVVMAVTAFRSGGVRVGDRIEHAGVVPSGYPEVLAALRITVVTQPGVLALRGDDYLQNRFDAGSDSPYPCGSLLAAGVAMGAGSDAPFGPLDPWLAMRTAVARRTASGAEIGLAERIGPEAALALFLGRAEAPGRPRRVAVGELGDLCVLRTPIREVLADLGSHQVAAVVVDGAVHVMDRG